jgi:hypothetical protein
MEILPLLNFEVMRRERLGVLALPMFEHRAYRGPRDGAAKF